uniref:Orf147a protein n=1 Tax=Solanum tuberosum TaxID=4113 RepID=M1D352_SOLTU
MEQYSIKKVYEQMRGDREKVEWRKLIWSNYGAPKWLFILYLALNRRLSTKDRMAKWGVTSNLTCPLCQVEDEDIDHLFFACMFTAGIWKKLLAWQGIQRTGGKWHEEVQWATTHMKSNTSKANVYRMVMAGTIYHVWIERNNRIFQFKQRNEEFMIRHIIRDVHGRGSHYGKIGNRLQELNVYP